MPKGITKIEEYTFSGCNKLKHINLPDDIFYIGDWNFHSCQIDTFRIPSKLRIIGNYALPTNTKAYYYKTNNPETFEDVYLNNNATLFVPKGCVGVFRNNEYWSKFEYIVETGPVYISMIDTVKVYGEENPLFQYVSDGVELIGSPTFECEANRYSDIGDYEVIIGKGTIKNDTIIFTNGTLKVNKATLNVAIDKTEREYGEENPEFTLSYSGFKNNDTNTVLAEVPRTETIATKDSDVGEYDVVVTGGNAKNYDIICHNGVLKILKATLSVKVENVEREYGEENPEFTLSYSGFKNNDTNTVLTEVPRTETIATKDSDVGEYDVVVTGGDARNYQLNYQKGVIYILKAKLTASIGEYIMEQGEELPEIEIIYDGFKKQDDVSVLDVLPTYYINLPENYEPGEYEILLKGGEDNNYFFEYKNGTLKIIEASGIKRILMGNYPFNIYTLSGVRVRNKAYNMDGLKPGYYIIESNGRYYKMSVK